MSQAHAYSCSADSAASFRNLWIIRHTTSVLEHVTSGNISKLVQSQNMLKHFFSGTCFFFAAGPLGVFRSHKKSTKFLRSTLKCDLRRCQTTTEHGTAELFKRSQWVLRLYVNTNSFLRIFFKETDDLAVNIDSPNCARTNKLKVTKYCCMSISTSSLNNNSQCATNRKIKIKIIVRFFYTYNNMELSTIDSRTL